MAHLNWAQRTISATRGPHPERQTVLTLGLGAGERAELAEGLRELSAAPEEQIHGELRIDLGIAGEKPEKWTLYWKIKVGVSKLSLAHPQEHEWVASLTLAREHALKAADALQTPDEVTLGASASLASFSNFELVITKLYG